MWASDTCNLLLYMARHPKEDAKTLYNRWVSTVTHRLTQAEMQEALFVAEHPVDENVFMLIKEGMLYGTK